MRTLHSYVAKALLGLAAFMAPVMVGAADSPDIGSISVVNPSSTSTSASTSYSVTFQPASEHTMETGTEITLFMADTSTGNPSESGYDFSGVTYGPAIGISATGADFGEGIGYQLTLTDSTLSASASFGLNNVVNPETAGCYYLMMTTDEPNQDADYTNSDIFSIGGADCEDEEVPGGSGGELEYTTVVMGDHVALSWDAVEVAANVAGETTGVTYEVLYSTDPDTDFKEGGNPERVEGITGTSYVIADLDTSTEYSFLVQAFEDSEQVAYGEITAVTTGKKTLNKTRVVKPAPLAKQIKKKNFKAKLSEEVAASDFFTRYKIQVARKNGKVVKTDKMGASKMNKVVKGLKSGKKYKFRMKAVVDVNGTNVQSKWSKWSKNFTTKSAE